jgi:hypothetical protein
LERTIPSYIESACSGDFEILEEIFEDKYSEFLDCYWLLKEYTEFITSLDYERNKKNLELNVSFKDLKISDVVEGLKENIPDGKNVDISSKNKVVYLVFYKKS